MTVDRLSDLDLSYTPPFGSPLGRHPARRPRLDNGSSVPGGGEPRPEGRPM